MKTVRIWIILATLALAGAAGTSDGSAFRDAACRLDIATRVLSGAPASGTCQP
ncbi:MAG: hypothetical protein ACJ8J0_13720 [Longimicrobiaceae bacterium]|jgi:hypothetical protein